MCVHSCSQQVVIVVSRQVQAWTGVGKRLGVLEMSCAAHDDSNRVLSVRSCGNKQQERPRHEGGEVAR